MEEVIFRILQAEIVLRAQLVLLSSIAPFNPASSPSSNHHTCSDSCAGPSSYSPSTGKIHPAVIVIGDAGRSSTAAAAWRAGPSRHSGVQGGWVGPVITAEAGDIGGAVGVVDAAVAAGGHCGWLRRVLVGLNMWRIWVGGVVDDFGGFIIRVSMAWYGMISGEYVQAAAFYKKSAHRANEFNARQ